MGGIHVKGDTWIDLDPGFKTYEYTDLDPVTALGLDSADIIDTVDGLVIAGEAEDSFSVDFSTGLEVYNYFLTDTLPAMPDDPATLFAYRSQSSPSLPVAPAALPYAVLSRSHSFPSLPDDLRFFLKISLLQQNGSEILNYQVPLPKVSESSVSLFFDLGSDASVDIVDGLASTLLSDPIHIDQLKQLLGLIPTQLVDVQPVIQLNGLEVARGNQVPMAEEELLIVELSAPTVNQGAAQLELAAWGRYGIVMDLAGVSAAVVEKKVDEMDLLIQEYKQGAESSYYPILGSWFASIGTAWFAAVNEAANALAVSYQIAYMRYPSIAFVYPDVETVTIFGVASSVSQESFWLDVPQQLHVIASLTGSSASEIQYNVILGVRSSFLEGIVPRRIMGQEDAYGASSASAMTAAFVQESPIYGLHSGNIETILPALDDRYPSEIFRDAVNAGRIVIVSQDLPVIDKEPVVAYIVLDPQTGDGAYLGLRGNAPTDFGKHSCDKLPTGEGSAGNINPRGECEALLRLAVWSERIGAVLLLGVAIVAAATRAGPKLISSGGFGSTLFTAVGLLGVLRMISGAWSSFIACQESTGGAESCIGTLTKEVLRIINLHNFTDLVVEGSEKTIEFGKALVDELTTWLGNALTD